MTKQRVKCFIGMFILLLIASGCFYGTWFMLNVLKQNNESSYKANAAVVSVKREHRSTAEGRKYRCSPKLKFVTNKGKTVVVDSGWWNSSYYRVGDIVKIYVDNNNPYLTRTQDPGMEGILVFMLSGLGGLFLIWGIQIGKGKSLSNENEAIKCLLEKHFG